MLKEAKSLMKLSDNTIFVVCKTKLKLIHETI